MMSNDNVRDIVAWELPEVKRIGTCLCCSQFTELEEGDFCLDCLVDCDILAEDDTRNQDFLVELFGERI